MNKKLMALAVAGAFAAPATALAQASNVQIYGTMYIEYGYAKQGVGVAGQLNNADLLQTPGASVGFKGEEALGGGMSMWFQCESSADLRGGGLQQGAATGPGNQNSGIFCGRNSALGIKGSFGNIFAGNWDSPWKIASPLIMGTNETGMFGFAPIVYGGSSSALDIGSAQNALTFERRNNSSINYISPTWSGFSFGLQVTAPVTSLGFTSNATLGKPRSTGVGATYANGPLVATIQYEQHVNFGAISNTQKGTTDTGYMGGLAYRFGPVLIGGVLVKRNFDGGCNVINAVCTGDASVTSYGINADWTIQGPHELKFAYVKANSTSGANTAGVVGNLTFNGGAGQTGVSMWEIEYIYNFTKRSRISLGYAALNNDVNSRYGLSGFTAPAAGQNQSVFGTSFKQTF